MEKLSVREKRPVVAWLQEQIAFHESKIGAARSALDLLGEEEAGETKRVAEPKKARKVRKGPPASRIVMDIIQEQGPLTVEEIQTELEKRGGKMLEPSLRSFLLRASGVVRDREHRWGMKPAKSPKAPKTPKVEPKKPEKKAKAKKAPSKTPDTQADPQVSEETQAPGPATN